MTQGAAGRKKRPGPAVSEVMGRSTWKERAEAARVAV
jgi:hypothetical protein